MAADDLESVARLLASRFRLERFAHSLNFSVPDSRLRVQIQTDPRYSEFVPRAAEKTVLDLSLPVARIEDVMQGKIWAASDPGLRPSKRKKDLLDIARMLEEFPELRHQVPEEIQALL